MVLKPDLNHPSIRKSNHGRGKIRKLSQDGDWYAPWCQLHRRSLSSYHRPKLNGQNFTQWAQSVRIFLQGKGKEAYITGDSKQPEKGDSNLQKRQLENSLVMSWPLNTMTKEIGENFMYYKTAKEMWDAMKETYSNVDSTSAIFEIKSLLHDLRKGESSVIDYFNTLNRYWQQLDIYEEIEWKCPHDKKQYKKLVEKEFTSSYWGLTKTLMRCVEGSLELNLFQRSTRHFQR